MDAIAEAINLIFNNKVSLIENDDQNSTYYSFPNVIDVIDFKNNGNVFF